MDDLSDFERAVLDKLLSGDHPMLLALRAQAEKVSVVKRENTGVGFFCDLDVPSGVPFLKGDFVISDVYGDIEGLACGASFLVYITDGRLDLLEGVTFDDPWPQPQKVGNFLLRYINEPRKLLLPDPSSSAT